MSSIEIVFERPLLLLLLLPAAAIITIPFLLVPKKRRYTVKRVVPLVLHLLIAAALVFVTSGFTLVRQINDQAVILLMDLSHSTEQVQDGMKAHGQELLGLIDETTPIGVVVFGGDQLYCLRLGGGDRTLALQQADEAATDLEGALNFAASLAPDDKALRIILFTDGKPTDGKAENAAYELADRGIRLDAVYYDTTGIAAEEVQIGSFTAPQGVYKGKDATLLAEVKSNVADNVRIVLYENETEILSKEYTVKEGSNLIELTVTPERAGVCSYRLELQPSKDTVSRNNEAYACLSVADRSSVLIIADTIPNGQTLEEVLKTENDVTTVTAYRAPKTLAELCKYDMVILSNVQYYALPRGYEKILQSYVGGYGRTLLAVGGRDTFMYGDMQDTALQDMLPVTMSLEESTEGQSVALMLVLDCSSSMNGERFALAKQGAIRCLDAMSDNDYVGVVSFSKESSLEASPVRATEENKDALTRTISALELGRGTYYTEALELARAELEKSDANVKHILFLSDGQPSDSGYYDVAFDVGEQGITLSTIGLGYSSYILSSMADYGNGRYYYVSSAEELPEIMLSETEQAKVGSLIVGDFLPIVKEESPLTAELSLESIAPLGGYLGTTLKKEAKAVLVTEAGHPLYALWDYGAGKVACFTSDLNGGWSRSWLSDQTGKTLIRNMVKTTVSEVHCESSLIVETESYGKSVKLLVDSANLSADNTLLVTVTTAGQSVSYPIARVYPGRYEGILPVDGAGVYPLYLVEKDIEGKTVDELNTAMAFSYSTEYDEFAKGSEDLLQSLCELTNGRVFTDLQELAGVKSEGIKTVYDPVVPIAILLALWLLADIAVRKIRLKDLKGYYLKAKEILGKK